MPQRAAQPSLFSASETKTYEIIFDGGSRGNPGVGYGSFAVAKDGQQIALEERQYGNGVTNNEAEYQTLIEALIWLKATLNGDASSSRVEVFGDSLLVINQMTGKWKIKNDRIRALNTSCRKAMKPFQSVSFQWHGRENSVRVLGH